MAVTASDLTVQISPPTLSKAETIKEKKDKIDKCIHEAIFYLAVISTLTDMRQ